MDRVKGSMANFAPAGSKDNRYCPTASDVSVTPSASHSNRPTKVSTHHQKALVQCTSSSFTSTNLFVIRGSLDTSRGLSTYSVILCNPSGLADLNFSPCRVVHTVGDDAALFAQDRLPYRDREPRGPFAQARYFHRFQLCKYWV